MKNLWSKNLLIALLLFTNTATAAYVLFEKLNIKQWATSKDLVKPRENLKAKLVSKPKIRRKTPNLDKYRQKPNLDESDQLQACYENFLTLNPEKDEGNILFHWTLKKSGWIDTIKLVETDFNDEELTNCIQDLVMKTRFPAPRHPKGTIIAHKFKFHRKNISSVDF